MDEDAIPASWKAALAPVLATPEARRLGGWLREREASGALVYPPQGTRLAALDHCPLDETRVVILGQDPYHGPGQAHGLAFSVPEGVKVPPSLTNIYKELEADLGLPRPGHGDLTRWAEQGVLLLNNALTVEAGQAGSHQKIGWEAVTDGIIGAIAARQDPTVFMLWGKHAQQKAAHVPGLETGPHLVLTAPHPSPLSARTGFFGCGHFSKANAFLKRHGRGTIDWGL